MLLRGPLRPAVTNVTGNTPSQVLKALGLGNCLGLHSEAESTKKAEVAIASPEPLAPCVPRTSLTWEELQSPLGCGSPPLLASGGATASPRVCHQALLQLEDSTIIWPER